MQSVECVDERTVYIRTVYIYYAQNIYYCQELWKRKQKVQRHNYFTDKLYDQNNATLYFITKLLMVSVKYECTVYIGRQNYVIKIVLPFPALN